MTPGRLLIGFRAALFAALLACTALVFDYRHFDEPAFCGPKSGCAKVAVSSVGQTIGKFFFENVFGTTLPDVALFALIALMVFSFSLRPAAPAGAVGPDGRTYGQPTYVRGRIQIFALLSAIGGVITAAFVVIQATIHAFCLYCMIVDTSTMIAAACAVVFWLTTRAQSDAAAREQIRGVLSVPSIVAWSFATAFSVLLPWLWAKFPVNPPLPKAVAAMQEPGKVTIVSLTDFECPFCRKTHPILTELRKNPDVVFKRVMAPLGMHPHAGMAARAYLCVDEDKRDDMADQLYTAEPLTASGMVEMATSLGMDKEAFTTCVDADDTIAKLEADEAIFEGLESHSLPTTFIGKYSITGAYPERMRDAYKMNKGTALELPVWLLFAIGVAIAGAASVYSWRRSGDD